MMPWLLTTTPNLWPLLAVVVSVLGIRCALYAYDLQQATRYIADLEERVRRLEGRSLHDLRQWHWPKG
jgi:hypothetical protein